MTADADVADRRRRDDGCIQAFAEGAAGCNGVVVAPFAVFGNVQAGDFFFLVGADFHDRADDLIQDNRADDGEDVGDDCRDDLSEEQMRFAIE